MSSFHTNTVLDCTLSSIDFYFMIRLGTRDYVSAEMQRHAKAAGDRKAHFALLLNDRSAAVADKHTELYTRKGLLRRLNSLSDVAAWLVEVNSKGDVNTPAVDEATVLSNLRATLEQYDDAAARSKDQFGKVTFPATPLLNDTTAWYGGIVTPVLHYCMGGLATDTQGAVLMSGSGSSGNDNGKIGGLYAAGELVGGIHGANRLGGNALTECVVFGRAVGNSIADSIESPAIETDEIHSAFASSPPAFEDVSEPKATGRSMPLKSEYGREIDLKELQVHTTEDDCWLAVHGKVYDFSDFLEEHPAGVEAILDLAGTDATEAFEAVHSVSMLEDFEPLGPFAG